METTTRMGSRSSSRHGPAVQFSGKVRKWQKTWTKSGTSEKLQVFKWLPVSGDREEESEELPARKYRYLPLDIVHAQTQAAKEAQQAADAHPEPDPAPETDASVAIGVGEQADAVISQLNAHVTEATGPASGDAVGDATPVDRTGDENDGKASEQPTGDDEPGAGAARVDREAEIMDVVEALEGPYEGREEGATGEGVVKEAVETGVSGGATAKTTAGVIEESLVATGLVEEGDAAKVEARALARAVALDEMKRRLDPGYAASERGKDDEGQVQGAQTMAAASEGDTRCDEEGVSTHGANGGGLREGAVSKEDGSGGSGHEEQHRRMEEARVSSGAEGAEPQLDEPMEVPADAGRQEESGLVNEVGQDDVSQEAFRDGRGGDSGKVEEES